MPQLRTNRARGCTGAGIFLTTRLPEVNQNSSAWAKSRDARRRIHHQAGAAHRVLPPGHHDVSDHRSEIGAHVDYAALAADGLIVMGDEDFAGRLEFADVAAAGGTDIDGLEVARASCW
jgi:hypothetical protein